jgi:hypothetical protein
LFKKKHAKSPKVVSQKRAEASSAELSTSVICFLYLILKTITFRIPNSININLENIFFKSYYYLKFDLNALEGNARGVEESLLHPWSWKMEIPWKYKLYCIPEL